MSNLKNTNLENVNQLKSIENISPSVSKQYVPIYSSELVRVLSPEFEYVGGQQFQKGVTSHYFDLVDANKNYIRVYNSYDRSLALRVSLVSDGIAIDLGVDRLIHRGQRAKDFQETLEATKSDIIQNIKTTKLIIAKFATEEIHEEMAASISKVVFDTIGDKTKVQEYTNYADMLLEKNITIANYIKITLKNFFDGNYTYVSNGVKRNGRKKSSTLTKVIVENQVMKMLKDEYIEFFL